MSTGTDTLEIPAGLTVQEASSRSGSNTMDQKSSPDAPTRRTEVFHHVLRTFMALYLAVLGLFRMLGAHPRPCRCNHRWTVALTGSFYSENWIMAHLRPLARAKNVQTVYVVSTFPIPTVPGVKAVYPPRWLKSRVGDVTARLLTFIGVAFSRRPDLLGGFHIQLNGLLAILLARMVAGRSLYLCVGGPPEILGGGYSGDNRIFGRLETPDHVVERQLLRAVSDADVVVTMGTRAQSFFANAGVTTPCHVVSGGIDSVQFSPAEDAREYSVVLVGRLAPVKRIDIFLQAIHLAASRVRGLRALVVGDGRLRASLEQQAHDLGIADRVHFAGYHKNVGDQLRRARVFVLTSDSEGLALSLMEAMMCGLPAIVSDVGDLGDLVHDGVNGYLVPRRDPAAFAARIADLLANEARWRRFSDAARQTAMAYRTSTATAKWEQILVELARRPGRARSNAG